MKTDLYNTEGKKSGSIDLSDDVFGFKSKMAVIHQVYLALMANAREPWADTKDKSEIRGGGKKPWKQKGTGRARHGSIRSPIWRGGGITFGPLSIRSYKQKINKKTKKTAVKMCLSDKVTESKFIVVDSLPTDGKTRAIVALRAALPGLGKTTLLLASKKDEALMRATNNIQRLDLQTASNLNVIDLLHHQYIVTTPEGVKELEKRLL
ncbi:MAG: 50S ribosomal protein L4 [bacterium]|nr:50S ribosomal protein L4 [bacterium]